MSEANGRDNRDYSMFDRMSTEMLREILRKDFELPENEQSNTDAILYIMKLIAEREKENLPDPQEKWKIFCDSYLPEADGKSLYEDDGDAERQPAKPVRRKLCWKLAGFAAAAALIVGSSSFVSRASGEDLWGTLTRWTDEVFSFSQAEEQTQTRPDGAEGFSSLAGALEAYGLELPISPRWFPLDYSLESVTVDQMQPNIYFTAVYRKQEDQSFVISVIHSDDQGVDTTYEKDGTPVEVYRRGGIEHYLMSNGEYNTAAWRNGNNQCSISGVLSRDELKMMIDSVYEDE